MDRRRVWRKNFIIIEKNEKYDITIRLFKERDYAKTRRIIKSNKR